MALALNRTGVILKKCDLAAHKPVTNKACAGGTCQHTCGNVEKCPHAWTLRYSANGKQVEKSFKDEIRNTRTIYGSGRKLAQDFQLKLTVDKRSGDRTFADYAKTGRQNFGEAAEAFIARAPVNDRTRGNYAGSYRRYVKPAFGDMTLAQVAKDRDGVLDLLTVKMKHLSYTPRQVALMLITATLDEAVKAGKLAKHHLTGIELADKGVRKNHSDFVFPAYGQVKAVADGSETAKGTGICVWLMRGCGLRIEEALGVEKSDFRENGTVLRVSGQASREGTEKLPLKHRRRGEYRDVPVPSWLWEIVKDMPDGPLMPGNNGKPFERYNTVHKRFTTTAKEAGIPDGFTPHSLRHAYASAMLARGVQISELAHFLGHRDINVTHTIYGHLLPSAAARATSALDAEFAGWTTTQG